MGIEGRSKRIEGDGLYPGGPLQSTIPTMVVAFRPPNPLIIERVAKALGTLEREGRTIKDPVFASIRSIDGFLHIPDIRGTIDLENTSDEAPFSVIEYDPMRRTFTISGRGAGSIPMEISWYGFKAFPDDMAILGSRGEGGDVEKVPDEAGARIEHYLSLLRDWKLNRRTVFFGRSLSRGVSVLDALRLLSTG